MVKYTQTELDETYKAGLLIRAIGSQYANTSESIREDLRVKIRSLFSRVAAGV